MGGRPGKRVGVHSEWRIAFVRRVVAARNSVFPDTDYSSVGAAQRKMAEALKERTGREINYDNYRKYEIEDADKGGALLRQDLIVPFCEITRINPTALLEGPALPFLQSELTRSGKELEVRSRTGTY